MGKYMKVIAGMATTTSREDAMHEAIESLLPHVDAIAVYVNDGVDNLNAKRMSSLSDKVWFLDGPNHFGDLGDAGKFVMVTDEVRPNEHAYFISVDDDIVYPPTYVPYFASKIDEYMGEKIVGIHGKIIGGKVSSYYRDRNNITWYHHLKQLDHDKRVHLLGTGLMGFRLDIPLAMTIDDLRKQPRNAADIHMAVRAQEEGIGMVCIAHHAHFVSLSLYIDHMKDTIFARHANNDAPHTELVNSIDWNLY